MVFESFLFLFAHVVDPDACLKAHNEKRALHPGTPMLVWDDTLAQHAKTWADHLAGFQGNAGARRKHWRRRKPLLFWDFGLICGDM